MVSDAVLERETCKGNREWRLTHKRVSRRRRSKVKPKPVLRHRHRVRELRRNRTINAEGRIGDANDSSATMGRLVGSVETRAAEPGRAPLRFTVRHAGWYRYVSLSGSEFELEVAEEWSPTCSLLPQRIGSLLLLTLSRRGGDPLQQTSLAARVSPSVSCPCPRQQDDVAVEIDRVLVSDQVRRR